MRIPGLLAALGLAAAAVPATALPLVNGGFELETGPAGRNYEFGASFPSIGQAVTGWNSPNRAAYNLLFRPDIADSGTAIGRFAGTGVERLWDSYPGPSPQGGNFVGLDGDSTVRGPLEQLLTGLTKGAAYDLTFFWAAGQIRSRTGATTEQLQVNFGNQFVRTAIVANPSEGFTGWFAESFRFRAGTTSALLSFLSIGTPNGLPPIALLDGVAVTQTPEPAALALFGLGALALGTARRRAR